MYVACEKQMASALGVIPLSPLMLYQGPNTDHARMTVILTLHRVMMDSNCPNYMGI